MPGHKPKFYIGTRADRCEEIKGVRFELEQAGWQQTYAWEPYFNGDVAKHRETGNAERDGVLAADVVCISLPGGYGTHVEFGMALARHRVSGGRNLLVLHIRNTEELDPYGDGKPSPFYYCDGVTLLHCPMDALATNLQSLYAHYRTKLEGLQQYRPGLRGTQGGLY